MYIPPSIKKEVSDFSQIPLCNFYLNSKHFFFHIIVIRLKEIDIEYKTNLNIPKHILMITAWITELSKDDQNKVRLYLFNRVCN